MPRSPQSIRPRAVLTVVGIVLAVLFVLTLGYLAWRVITWMLIALFLALALDHAVSFFERRGLRRGLAVAVVSVLVVVVFGGIGFVFIPPLVAQIVNFVDAIPDLLERLTEGRGPLGFLEEEFGLVERARQFLEDEGVGTISGLLGALAGPLLTVVQNAVVVAIAIVSIVFLTLFMLLEGPRWVARGVQLVPPEKRPYWERGLHGVYGAIGGWVIGALAIALVAGTSATVVLLALGVPFAFSLGLVVAVLDPIPFIGATLAAAIVSLVVFATKGIVLAAIVLGFFVVYQQLENNLLYPLVYGQTVRLSPLAVLVAVLLGGELAGILGAIAAIPIGGAVHVVLHEVLRYRRERAVAPLPEEPRRALSR